MHANRHYPPNLLAGLHIKFKTRQAMYVRTVQRNIAARSCNVYTSSATLTDLDHFSLLGAIHSQLN